MCIYTHTPALSYARRYICACECVCVFSPLIDESIFQVIKSSRTFCTRIAVTTTERSYSGEENHNAKNKENWNM